METGILALFDTRTTLIIHLALAGGVAALFSRQHKNGIDDSPVKEKNDKPIRIFIPDLVAGLPWSRRISPHYETVKKESDIWMAKFKAFSPKAQEALDRCNLSLLAGMGYPDAIPEHVRAGCDLMNLLFTFDEHSDCSEPSEVLRQKEVILDALKNPDKPRPKSEWVGGELARQFWKMTIENATPVSQKRFIAAMDEYLGAVVQETMGRQDHRILDIESFINLRRRTVAARPSFCILQLGLDIPDEVISHPVIQEISNAAIDMIAFSNDLFSYNMERLRGCVLHNVLTCAMKEYNTDVNGAILWIEDYLRKAVERFMAGLKSIPEFEEPANSQVREYCNGLGQFVRGTDDWSFESERYFGEKGLEIRDKKWMLLLPMKNKAVTEVGPVHVDSDALL